MRIITFVMFSQNGTKTYAKLHILGIITLKLVHNFTQNHTFAKFSKTVQNLCKITHFRCTLKSVIFSKGHICDIISKQYKNQWKNTYIWCTLKLVHNFTHNHTFAKFSQTVQKPMQNHTCSVHSQNSTKLYAKSYICDILSKQYKNQCKNHICCALSKVYNILRKITHLRCTLKTLQTPRQNSTIAVSPPSPPHLRSNHANLGAVSKQYETNFTQNHTFVIFRTEGAPPEIMHFGVQSQSSTKQISRNLTHL